MSRAFARGLSDDFMQWLQAGTGRILLDLFRGEALDIRLRDDHFNVYEAQCSVAKVEWKRMAGGTCQLSVHEAYVRGLGLTASGRAGGYECFRVTDAFVSEYARALPDLRRTAIEWHGKEGLLESACVRDNIAGTPLLAFDRQIVLPGRKDRLDVLAVSADRLRPVMVAVELKRGLNNDIQGVARQTLKYMEMLDPTGAGLRHDVGVAYERVCDQMRALGWPAPAAGLIRPGMPVVGLAALAEYNAESKLLQRAQSDATTLARPIAFCQLDMSHLVLPDPETWLPASPSP